MSNVLDTELLAKDSALPESSFQESPHQDLPSQDLSPTQNSLFDRRNGFETSGIPSQDLSPTQNSLLADPRLAQMESDLADVEAVLSDLDDLDALRQRVGAAYDDGSIAHRYVLAECAEKLGDKFE